MRSAGVDWSMNVYPGATPIASRTRRASDLGMPGGACHAATDERSWPAMLDLFGEPVPAD